ncbi:double-stranded RNA-specific editase 1 isoform X2 [Sipha flava]|nr:double-stranded RNA-specific editase 1 isoform X2 [Sipha flava]
MPYVATFVTAKSSGQTQMHQQSVALNNLPPPIQYTQSQVQNPVSQFSEVSAVKDKNNMIKNKDDQCVDESTSEKTEVKWPTKRKINKKEQKKRLNARMRRLVCPKSPLMVFSELYKDVPIKLEDRLHNNNFVVFTASIEIDGQVYTGDHVSKTQAKQKACENFLRVMLAKKMNERPEKKDECFEESKIEDESVTSSKPKGPPQEDFPWPHFASLAMHNLIAHWELQPVTKVMPEETVKTPPKVGGMKKFPNKPENYNPVQLLHQMSPGIQFTETTINSNNPSCFEVKCKMDGVTFAGKGSTKKAAKKECAIATIKYFWNFDFHTVEKK